MQEVAGEGAAGAAAPSGPLGCGLSDTVHLQGKSRAVVPGAQVSAGTWAETGASLCPGRPQAVPVICKGLQTFEGGRQDLSL